MTRIETSITRWQVEDARAEHVDRIRELFKQVFKQEMTHEQWQWKYGNGRGGGVIVRDGDEIVSYFGGAQRRVLFKGEAAVAFQSGDSMVAEKHRGTLSKKGPFYLSVTAFQERYLGHGKPYLLSYGFPNARAMRLAQRLGMYADIGSLVDISWPAQGFPGFHAVDFDFDSTEHQQLLAGLWSTMAAEFSDRSIGVRDLEYLQHRYHAHPTLNYRLQLVYLEADDSLAGILVTRKVDDRLLLVDLVASKAEVRNLIFFGRQLASELECRELYGWLTEVDCHLVAGTGESIAETPLRLPFGVFCEGLNPDEIRDKWFFLCGDSDFL